MFGDFFSGFGFSADPFTGIVTDEMGRPVHSMTPINPLSAGLSALHPQGLLPPMFGSAPGYGSDPITPAPNAPPIRPVWIRR